MNLTMKGKIFIKMTKKKNNNIIWQPKKSNLFSFKPIKTKQNKNKINPYPFMKINVPKKIKKHNMSWGQAKKTYTTLNPFADADRDGVPNFMDCRPFDKKRHNIISKIQAVINPAVQAVQKAYISADKAVGGYLPGGVPVKKKIEETQTQTQKTTEPVTKTTTPISKTVKSAGSSYVQPISKEPQTQKQIQIQKENYLTPTPTPTLKAPATPTLKTPATEPVATPTPALMPTKTPTIAYKPSETTHMINQQSPQGLPEYTISRYTSYSPTVKKIQGRTEPREITEEGYIINRFSATSIMKNPGKPEIITPIYTKSKTIPSSSKEKTELPFGYALPQEIETLERPTYVPTKPSKEQLGKAIPLPKLKEPKQAYITQIDNQPYIVFNDEIVTKSSSITKTKPNLKEKISQAYMGGIKPTIQYLSKEKKKLIR
jgi:hypothetical protein